MARCVAIAGLGMLLIRWFTRSRADVSFMSSGREPREAVTQMSSALAFFVPRRLAALAGLLLVGAAIAVPAASTENPSADIVTMRLLALELLREEDYEGSIEMYRAITRRTPDDPRSHYDLAGALSFLRLYEEAIEPIETAIRLDPSDVRAHDMAALIFSSLRRYDEAFAETLIAAELGETTAMYSLSYMYEKGIGVTADQDQAVYWAEQAAEHGHLGAMVTLEEAYRTGRFGRPIDTKRADAWAKRLRDAE